MENNARRTIANTSPIRLETQGWENMEARSFHWNILRRFMAEEDSTPAAAEFLFSLAGLDDEEREVAVSTLGEIGMQLPEGSKKSILVETIAKCLDDPVTEVRVAAVCALGKLGRDVPIEAIVTGLIKDKHPSVRATFAEALGEFTELVLLCFLKEALKDPDWKVRAAIVQALGQLSEHAIIQPLRAALDDRDFSVRSAAIYALGTLKGSLSTDYLVSVAQGETNDWISRDAAVTVLERLGENALAEPLREALDGALEDDIALPDEEVSAPVDAQPSSESTAGLSSSASSVPEGLQEPTGEGEIEVQAQQRENEETYIEVDTGVRHLPRREYEKEGAADLSQQDKGVGKRRYFPWPRRERKAACASNKVKRKRAADLSQQDKGVGKRRYFPWPGRERKVACASNMMGGEGKVPIRSLVCVFLLAIVVVPLTFIGSPVSHSFAASAQSPSNHLLFVTVHPQPTSVMITQQQDDALLFVTAQPRSVAPGQKFQVSLRAVNIGRVTWSDTGEYELVCAGYFYFEATYMGPKAAIHSYEVPPKGDYIFVVQLVAPVSPGVYHFWWTMADGGSPFGSSVYSSVIVS